MPRVPSISPATGQPTPPSYLHTTDCNFVDNAGRTVILRGVNLSGASKAPLGHPSQILDDFWESAEAGGESFVGRPLNLDDGSADIHLARLRGWGFNLLRFPFTWEALEHEGPGIYDYEFMDYTIRVLQKCKDYGFRVFMDPHQDTWSRFSGGSGAPFWTLAACGINPSNITATQAAIVHCEYPTAYAPDPAKLPAMIWSTNYGRLLSQTVFTLFFAGRVFAPSCIIDNVNIQDYLQSHYIEACGQLADRILAYDGGSLYDECIIGWDSLNEPFEGLVGWDDLNVNPTKQGSTLKKGTYPTPAQSFILGMGQPQTVEHWTFGALGPSQNGTVTIDPKGHKLWADPMQDPNDNDNDDQASEETPSLQTPSGELPDGTNERWGWKRNVQSWMLGRCIWAQHGVWDVETGFILRPDYFKYHPLTGEEVEFITDFWRPHWQAYMARIRPSHPEAVWFIQPPVFARPPPIDEKEELKGRCAYSTHYYDGLTLLTRHWNWFNADALGLLRGKYSSTLPAVKIGEAAIRRSLQEQLGMLKADAEILGAYPTVIGEIGTPFDMDAKRAYGWTDGGKHKGDYGQQQKALDASLNACDGVNALNYTIWTFCPDDHTHEWGDGWNLEDLSLWSPADVWENQRKKQENRWGRKRRRARGEATRAGGEGGNAESRVSLVTQAPKPWLAMMAAASSLSLATLGTATLTDAASLPSQDNFMGEEGGPVLLGWHSNPFDFLTDGARAVKAFARPYPVKTVGRPVSIQFDVNKASFKLVIAVRSEDSVREGALRPKVKRVSLGSSRDFGRRVAEPVESPLGVEEVRRSGLEEEGVEGDEEEGEEEEEEPLGTEIYLPLVHFAHPRLLDSPSRRRWVRAQQRELDVDAQSISTVSSGRSQGFVHPEGNSTSTSAAAAGRGAAATSSLAPPNRRTVEDGIEDGEASPALTDSPVPMNVGLGLRANESFGSIDTAVECRQQEQQRMNSPSIVPVVGAVPIYHYPGKKSFSSSSSSSPTSHHPKKRMSSAFSSPIVPNTKGNSVDGRAGEDGVVLDVEVKVSEGRWRVEGQTLVWWYDCPGEGEVPKEVVVEVRRRGGAVKAREVRARQETWCEQLCPEEGCRVM